MRQGDGMKGLNVGEIATVADRVTAWVNRTQAARTPLAFLVGVVKKYSDDAASQQAALMTYYTFLSLFPLALIVVAVLSRVLAGNPELRDTIIRSVIDDERVLATAEQSLAGLSQAGILLWIGLLGFLLTGLGGIMAATTVLNQVWAVPHRQRFAIGPRYLRALGGLLILGVGIGAVGFLNGVLLQRGADRLLTLPVTMVLSGMALTGASLLLTARPIPRRGVLIGGVLGGLLIGSLAYLGTELGTLLIARAGPVYGGLATVVGTLALFYLGCQALVITGEVASVASWRLWPRSLDSRQPLSGDEAAYDLIAQVQERVPGMRVAVTWLTPAVGGGDLHSGPESARML